MAFTPNPDSILVEGYYVPQKTEEEHGPPAGSVEWLLNAVARHAAAESDSLEQYEYLRTASGDPVVALVMRLILEDEERHHGLLRRIEASLRDAVEWTHSPSALPSSAAPTAPLPEDLAAVARQLVDEERSGARKMRARTARSMRALQSHRFKTAACGLSVNRCQRENVLISSLRKLT